MLPHHFGIMPFLFVIIGLMTWGPSFFVRVHHLPLAEVGVKFGAAVSVGTVLALPLHGWIVDRLFQRGHLDVHLRYTICAFLAGAPLFVSAFLVSSPQLAFVLIGVFFAVTSGYMSLPGALLQVIIPSSFRGKAASVALAIHGIVTIGAGPTIVAAVTEGLGGPMMVGKSLALCALVGIPLSAILLSFALAPVRRLLAERERT